MNIAKFIRQTKGIYTKARYKEISKKLSDVSKALKNKVDDNIDIDGVIDYELKKQKKLLNEAKPYLQKVKGGTIDFLYPSLEQIKTAALFKPVDTKYGMTYQSYLEGIENGLYNIWDSAVRTGYLTGQTTQQVVSSVLGGLTPQTKLIKQGMINSYRNSIYASTRTVLQSFANETMNRVYEENDKYFGDTAPDGKIYKYEYLATLDNRVCVICGEDSGRLYKELSEVPQLPRHRGCRCVILPYFNIEGETRASKDGYTDKKSFSDWLENQDKETQMDVLGATRYKLYKEGVTIDQFVDNGKVITLDELKNKIKIKENPKLTKSMYVDDFYSMGKSNNIQKEVLDEIVNVIEDYENKYKFFVNDFYIGSIEPVPQGTPILQVEPYGRGLIRLNVNTDVLSNKSLKEINEIIAKTDINLAQSLREATIHECGHIRLINGRSINDIIKLYEELEPLGIKGVSQIALQDGVEAVAEIEILKARGGNIDKNIIDFYNKYVENK